MNRSEHYATFGFWCSCGLHIAAILYMLFGMPANNISKAEIFTVDLLSGNNLGGISQPPEDASQVQPVAGSQQEETRVEEKPEEVKKEEPKEEPKEEEVKEEDPDAFRLDKFEPRNKPTPTPTPVQPKAQPTPASTPAPKPSASPKATQAPKKVDPKPQPSASLAPKKMSAQDINNAYQKAMAKALGESVNAGGVGVGSTGKGGKGFGGGVGRSPEWLAYYNRLTAYVKKGWNWHDAGANISGSVSFNIAPDGKVSGVKLNESSGDTAFDNSIIRAVNRANPVPAPPPSVYEDFKFVAVKFKPE